MLSFAIVPFCRRSRLLAKSPQIYNRLEGIPVDFFNKEDDKLDPYYELHIQEDKLVSENRKKISKEVLWLNIRRVFSQPTPVEGNQKVIGTIKICWVKSKQCRSFQVGTFLYRKLGRLGLVLYLQTFTYRSILFDSENPTKVHLNDRKVENPTCMF